MSSEGTPANGGTGGTPAGGAAAPWYNGADATVVGHIQNRGWDKLTPDQAALNAVKSHMEAEKHLGVPADQLVRFPKDANDAENWGKLSERLGVPKEAKEYDFSTVKLAGDKPLPTSLTEALAPVLQSAHVSKTAAPEVMKALANYLDTQAGSEVTDKAANLATERETLKINWGSNVEANMLVAKQAAAALGVKPEAVAALENTIGYAATMEMFRNIGTKIGEDAFVSNKAPGGTGVMSVDQAKATLAEKQNDGAWNTKLMSGDALAVKEFNNLTTIIASAGR